MKNFAVTGVAGYIAPRHLRAIKDTGNRLIAAIDTHDSTGILDSFGFDVRFFTEIERFDRHLEKLRRGPYEQRAHFITICAPNYLHDAHCRLALRLGADAICEKPLVINPWNLDALQELESEYGRRIYTVLQLRVHPKLLALRERLLAGPKDHVHDVVLTYITARGGWYDVSWKGVLEKSGGIATNIGIHLFDLLLWLFGGVDKTVVHLGERRRMAGYLELERARVRWYLSVSPEDLAPGSGPGVRASSRSILIDGEEVEFTEGFTDLHTKVYEETLQGRGFGIEDARPSVGLAYSIRTAAPQPAEAGTAHPLLQAAAL
jgi:UDP-N-acetyl-2-amino-2-deoxyglucuronate dehydrogenase